jgi:hypothetical protein
MSSLVRASGTRQPFSGQVHIGEVLFEFRRIGNVVKVSAIHVDTDTEVCLVGSPAAGEYGLKMAAMRRLVFVLRKRQDQAPTG